MQSSNKVWMTLVVIIGIIAIGVGVYVSKVSKGDQPPLGAVATLDGVDLGFMRINGQREFRWARGLNATSSMLCVFQNPYAATSSIKALSIEVTARGGTGVAAALYVSTSSSSYGSSTPALVQAFPMGTGQFSVEFQPNAATTSVASSVGSTGNADLLAGRTATGYSNYVLGPSEFITWRVATTTPSAFTTYMTGECSAVIKKI